MRVVAVSAQRYDLPLHRPIMLRNCLVTTRSGIVLSLASDSGVTGRGDIAPLPGFSAESLAQAAAAAATLPHRLLGREIPLDPDERVMWSDRVSRWLWRLDLPTSVVSGVQAALGDLVAAHRGVTLAQVFDPAAEDEVLVNGLLLGDADNVLADAARLRASGFRAAKLKVGRADPLREAELVRRVYAVLGPDTKLRLDANRAWSEEVAFEFARAIDGCAIEYIEEPLRDPSRLVSFSRRSGLPVALDETVSERAVDDLERWRGIRAVVLKPTLLGGYEFALWMARRAANAGMSAVVSASFESGIGIAALACLAASFCQPAVAAGLDTYRWLAADAIDARLDMSHGRLSIREAVRAMRAPLSACVQRESAL